MSRRHTLALTLVLLALAALGTAPTALAGDPCFHSMTNRPPTTTGATVDIAIGDCVFAPTVAFVPVGTTVTWRNTSGQGHEVVGSNLEWGAHDKVLAPGDSIGWSFEKAGVYAYSCMLHPGMTGTIVVGGSNVGLASDVSSGSVEPAPAAGSGDSAVPVVVAGGIGILAGAVGAGLLLRRREPAA